MYNTFVFMIPINYFFISTNIVQCISNIFNYLKYKNNKLNYTLYKLHYYRLLMIISFKMKKLLKVVLREYSIYLNL